MLSLRRLCAPTGGVRPHLLGPVLPRESFKPASVSPLDGDKWSVIRYKGDVRAFSSLTNQVRTETGSPPRLRIGRLFPYFPAILRFFAHIFTRKFVYWGKLLPFPARRQGSCDNVTQHHVYFMPEINIGILLPAPLPTSPEEKEAFSRWDVTFEPAGQVSLSRAQLRQLIDVHATSLARKLGAGYAPDPDGPFPDCFWIGVTWDRAGSVTPESLLKGAPPERTGQASPLWRALPLGAFMLRGAERAVSLLRLLRPLLPPGGDLARLGSLLPLVITPRLSEEGRSVDILKTLGESAVKLVVALDILLVSQTLPLGRAHPPGCALLAFRCVDFIGPGCELRERPRWDRVGPWVWPNSAHPES